MVAFACACQQKQSDMNGNGSDDQKKSMDDQNYQDRRKQMQQQKPQGGCCEAEKSAKVEVPQQSATVATPEVKVEKAQ